MQWLISFVCVVGNLYSVVKANISYFFYVKLRVPNNKIVTRWFIKKDNARISVSTLMRREDRLLFGWFFWYYRYPIIDDWNRFCANRRIILSIDSDTGCSVHSLLLGNICKDLSRQKTFRLDVFNPEFIYQELFK